MARFAACFTCAVKALGAAKSPGRGYAGVGGVLLRSEVPLRVAVAPQRIVFAAVEAIASSLAPKTRRWQELSDVLGNVMLPQCLHSHRRSHFVVTEQVPQCLWFKLSRSEDLQGKLRAACVQQQQR